MARGLGFKVLGFGFLGFLGFRVPSTLTPKPLRALSRLLLRFTAMIERSAWPTRDHQIRFRV